MHIMIFRTWFLLLLFFAPVYSSTESIPRLTPRLSPKVVSKTFQTFTKMFFFAGFDLKGSVVEVHRPAYGFWNETEGLWNVRLDAYVRRRPQPFLLTSLSLDIFAQLMIWFSKPKSGNERNQRRLLHRYGRDFLTQPVQGHPYVLEYTPSSTSMTRPNITSFTTVIDDRGLSQQTDYLGNLHGYAKVPALHGIESGSSTTCLQQLRVCGVNGNTGFTSQVVEHPGIQLVPSEGLTIVSDVDDILRVAKIWNLKRMLEYMFMRDAEPWMNMPSVFAEWEQRWPNTHFHYDSLVPEPFDTAYTRFLSRFYPIGSFNSRAYGLLPGGMIGPSTWRSRSVAQVLDDFPDRRAILMGDTSNEEIFVVFSHLATRPQVACVLLRNVSLTEGHFPGGRILEDLQVLDENTRRKFVFYGVPEEIRGLDLAGGKCR